MCVEICEMKMQDFKKIENNLCEEFDSFWNAEILKNELNAENRKYIIAKKNEQILGFAGVLLGIDDAEIMNIVVKKMYRRKGIGTLLLHKLIETSKKLKKEKIFLEVNENNREAIKLYENAGFHQISIRKNYYNNVENAIIMSKNLIIF